MAILISRLLRTRDAVSLLCKRTCTEYSVIISRVLRSLYSVARMYSCYASLYWIPSAGHQNCITRKSVSYTVYSVHITCTYNSKFVRASEGGGTFGNLGMLT